ncbi:MAG TPA: tetratricopeptide repeat protein [bacterium]|nr:tetratricopeptide repeat protein [bacterium]HPN44624.1 tetratricopeptide repeat protein [bacterium]
MIDKNKIQISGSNSINIIGKRVQFNLGVTNEEAIFIINNLLNSPKIDTEKILVNIDQRENSLYIDDIDFLLGQARIYKEKSLYKEASQYYKVVYHLVNKRLSSIDMNMLKASIIFDFASLQMNQGIIIHPLHNPINLFNMAFKIYEDVHDYQKAILAQKEIGVCNHILGNGLSSIKYYKNCFDLIKNMSEYRRLEGNIFREIGIALNGLGRYHDAEKCFLKAINLLELYGDSWEIGMANQKIAISYIGQKKYERAYNYLYRSIKTLDKSDELSKVKSIAASSLLLYKTGNIVKADKMIENGFHICNRSNFLHQKKILQKLYMSYRK